jgi:5'-methylthioadenosine phosphorylase
MCYITVAMVTDYDCWHPGHDAVTVTEIIETLTKNAENATKLVHAVVRTMPPDRTCKCGSALAHALITDKKAVPEATLKNLELIVGKYFRDRT